jgi:hypothetical protein
MMAPFPRFRRRPLCWALLALPALLLRALIPPGFMPVAGEQGFGIEFCPDAAALPPGIAAASAGLAHHHHAHTGGAGHGDDPGSALHHAPCLFAASATLATAPVHAVPLAAPPAGDGPGERVRTGQLFPPTILRAQSPRGPPPSA